MKNKNMKTMKTELTYMGFFAPQIGRLQRQELLLSPPLPTYFAGSSSLGSRLFSPPSSPDSPSPFPLIPHYRPTATSLSLARLPGSLTLGLRCCNCGPAVWVLTGLALRIGSAWYVLRASKQNLSALGLCISLWCLKSPCYPALLDGGTVRSYSSVKVDEVH